MRIQGHKRKVWTVRTLQIRSEDIDTPTDGTETYFSFPHQERRKKCLFYHAFFSLSSFPAAAACCCVMAYLYTYFFLPQFDISRLHPKEFFLFFFSSYNCFVFDGIGVGREGFFIYQEMNCFSPPFPANQKCFFD